MRLVALDNELDWSHWVCYEFPWIRNGQKKFNIIEAKYLWVIFILQLEIIFLFKKTIIFEESLHYG